MHADLNNVSAFTCILLDRDMSDEGESSIARLKRRAKQRGKRAGRGSVCDLIWLEQMFGSFDSVVSNLN